jgi:hypothetical protein
MFKNETVNHAVSIIRCAIRAEGEPQGLPQKDILKRLSRVFDLYPHEADALLRDCIRECHELSMYGYHGETWVNWYRKPLFVAEQTLPAHVVGVVFADSSGQYKNARKPSVLYVKESANDQYGNVRYRGESVYVNVSAWRRAAKIVHKRRERGLYAGVVLGSREWSR